MFNKLRKGISAVIKKFKIKELNEKSLQKPIDELVNFMIRNEVASQAAFTIGDNLKKKLLKHEHERFKNIRPFIQESLRETIVELLTPPGSDFDLIADIRKKRKEEEEPYVILMLGINGTGKTTSLAKLARLLQKNNLSVVFAAGDTFRAGAIDQITEHGNNLQIRTISHQYGGDPAAVSIDAIDHAISKDIDVVIVDTAGRMQNNDNLVRELEKIVRNAEPDLKLFVGDALTGNDIIRQAETFDERIGIDGIILTKMDADLKGGAALSVTHAIQRPILYIGTGQSYDDLKTFDAKSIAKDMVP